jgi:hypothetical protein
MGQTGNWHVGNYHNLRVPRKSTAAHPKSLQTTHSRSHAWPLQESCLMKLLMTQVFAIRSCQEGAKKGMQSKKNTGGNSLITSCLSKGEGMQNPYIYICVCLCNLYIYIMINTYIIYYKTFKKLTDCPQQDSSKPCDPTHPSIRSFRPTTSCSS